eukprot:CFRG5673T1
MVVRELMQWIRGSKRETSSQCSLFRSDECEYPLVTTSATVREAHIPRDYTNFSFKMQVMSSPSLYRGMKDEALQTMQTSTKSFEELLKDYGVVKSLRDGSTAEVYVARHRVTGRLVIIKEQVLAKRDRSAIHMEASLHGRCNHPNVAKLYATAMNQKVMIMLAEYLGGGDLSDVIIPEKGLTDRTLVRKIMVQLVSATKYLHSIGIAHRDIKPENIVLSEDKKIAKIIDFGLSEIVLSNDVSATYRRHVGTLPYMPPELLVNQTDSNGCVDMKAADVWALGVVLFCMLTGRFAWSESSSKCIGYRRYSAGDFSHVPWDTIPHSQLTLLKNMLNINVKQRWTIEQVQEYMMKHWSHSTNRRRKDSGMSSSMSVNTNQDKSYLAIPSQSYSRDSGFESMEDVPSILRTHPPRVHSQSRTDHRSSPKSGEKIARSPLSRRRTGVHVHGS